jgi:hypothetical protein
VQWTAWNVMGAHVFIIRRQQIAEKFGILVGGCITTLNRVLSNISANT